MIGYMYIPVSSVSTPQAIINKSEDNVDDEFTSLLLSNKQMKSGFS